MPGHYQLHRPATHRTLLAAITTCLLLGACTDAAERNAAAFRAAKELPVMLNLARERDVNSNEPLRALPASPPVELTPLATLGRRLFHDTALSGDNSVSCASCHDPAAGGDDGLRTSLGIRGSAGPINAPTVLNSAFNFRQFWDGRAADLDQQARGPVTNPLEMGAAWDQVVNTLNSDAGYPDAFAAAFGDKLIDEDRIAAAIAAFERTLITPSPFDRYLLGDASAIDEEARHGYELFKDYGCVACHQGINIGGNLYQKFGALAAAFEISTETDRGRNNVTGSEEDLAVFKVPSLRNVALTAPYFHLGTVNDLHTAVRIMANVQLGRTLGDQEIALIVAFLETLTGAAPQYVAIDNSTGE